VYVRSFDLGYPTASGSGAGKVKVSVSGGASPIWRADGRELLYSSGRTVWSVDVATTPVFHAGLPKLLFEGPPGSKAAAPDAQRFLFDVPVGKTSAKVMLNWQAAEEVTAASLCASSATRTRMIDNSRLVGDSEPMQMRV
jgi:hypothetical protein